MSYIPFYRADTKTRLETLAADIDRMLGDVKQMVDSKDFTLCKMLKLQAEINDLQTKAKHTAKHA